MKRKSQIHNGHQIWITTEWTGRKITITAEHGLRTAMVHRALSDELWSVTFTKVTLSTDHFFGTRGRFLFGTHPEAPAIELTGVSDNMSTLVDAGIRFVVYDDFPSSKHFEILNAIRTKELNLISGLIKQLNKPSKRRRRRITSK